MADVFDAVDQFISNRFSREDAVLKSIGRSLKKAGIGNISVSSTQGKFLHLLALLSGAKRILEIGTLGGYSTIWMARALPRSGRLITIEKDPAHARIAARHIAQAGLSRRVDLRVGAAMHVLAAIAADGEAPFDMVFIDADKEPYEKYFRWSLRLTHPGSLIVADNVVRRGRVVRAGAGDSAVQGVQKFLRTLGSTRRVTATVLQTVGPKGHDGMALAVVR